jgi:hypothetical protein
MPGKRANPGLVELPVVAGPLLYAQGMTPIAPGVAATSLRAALTGLLARLIES